MKAYKFYILPVLWIVVISILSTPHFGGETTTSWLDRSLKMLNISMSAGGLDILDFFVRKTAHLAEYAILAALWLNALVRGSGVSFRKALVLTLLVSVAVASGDEFHQSFEAGRTAKVTDALLDSSGAALSLLCISAIKKRRTQATL